MELVLLSVKKKKYYITLEELPENPRLLAKADTDVEHELGFKVEDVSSKLLTEYQIRENVEGVIVTNVDRRSEAFSAGLRSGDVITRVGRQEVKNTKLFFELLDQESRGNTVLFLVKRGEASRFLTLEM